MTTVSTSRRVPLARVVSVAKTIAGARQDITRLVETVEKLNDIITRRPNLAPLAEALLGAGPTTPAAVETPIVETPIVETPAAPAGKLSTNQRRRVRDRIPLSMAGYLLRHDNTPMTVAELAKVTGWSAASVYAAFQADRSRYAHWFERVGPVIPKFTRPGGFPTSYRLSAVGLRDAPALV